MLNHPELLGDHEDDGLLKVGAAPVGVWGLMRHIR